MSSVLIEITTELVIPVERTVPLVKLTNERVTPGLGPKKLLNFNSSIWIDFRLTDSENDSSTKFESRFKVAKLTSLGLI